MERKQIELQYRKSFDNYPKSTIQETLKTRNITVNGNERTDVCMLAFAAALEWEAEQKAIKNKNNE